MTMILMSILSVDGVDDNVFWTSKDLHSCQGDTNMTLAKNESDRCFLLWFLLCFPVQVVARC